MGYFVYYLAFMLAAYVLQRPPLLLGIVVFFLLRPFLVGTNSSSVQGYYLLGKARAERGDREGAAAAFREARSTFWKLPAFKKRGQTSWWLRSVIASILG